MRIPVTFSPSPVTRVVCEEVNISTLGSKDLQPTEKEMQIRNEYHRSITTSCDIEQGEVFTEQNLCMRRPGDGLSGSRWDDVIGKQAKHDIKANVQLTMEDIM